MAEEILTAHADRIEVLTIVPASGGRFVVMAGDREVFNKKSLGRFPLEGEVQGLLAPLI